MSTERKNHSGLVWVVVPLVVMLAYVLSLGPVAALTGKPGQGPSPALKRFYQPVTWLHNNTPLKEPLEAYATLWGIK